MKTLLITLAAVLLLPTLTEAQWYNPADTESRFSVTPYAALQVPLGLTGSYALPASDGARTADFWEDHRVTVALGVEGEMHVDGPFSAVASLTHGSPSRVTFHTQTEDGPVQQRFTGPRTWVASAGVRYRLPDDAFGDVPFNPGGFLTIGPAVVREIYDGRLFGGGLRGNTRDHSRGLQLGAHGSVQLEDPRMSLHIGMEDVIAWNRSPWVGRVTEAVGGPVSMQRNHRHILLLRAGLQYRF